MKSISLQVDMGHVLTQQQVLEQVQDHVWEQVQKQVREQVQNHAQWTIWKQVNKPLTPINFEAAYQQALML